MYIHQSLPFTEVTIDSTLEFVACKVKINGTYLAICSLYCPPDAVIAYDELFALQERLPQNKVILADFNAHHTLWGSLRVDGRGEQVVKLINESDLVLLNDGSPTRVDDNTGNLSFIDLSLVSSSIAAKCLWHTIDDSLGSDHLPILIKYSCDTVRTPSAPKFNVKRADWVAFTRSVKARTCWRNH